MSFKTIYDKKNIKDMLILQLSHGWILH